MCVNVYICMYMPYVYECVSVCGVCIVYMHVCVYMCGVNTYVCLSTCVYLYVYICVYMYINISRLLAKYCY